MDAITQVLGASTPDDLFQGLSGDALKKHYRKLARQTHPDRFGDDHKARATDAFNKLQALWDELNGKSVRPTSSAFTLSTKKHTYVFGEKLFSDAESTYFQVEYLDEDSTQVAWLRFGKTPGDNAALDRHVKALKKLAVDVPDEFKVHHLVLVDAARHRESSTRVERRVVVTQPLDGYKSLREVKNIRDRWYPADARDMAWIFRRLLVIVGTAHDAGVSVGDITMDNIYVNLTEHLVALLDWSTSAELTEAARVKDIHHAVACMETLLDKQAAVPAQISAFFNGCRVSKLPSASRLLGEFDDLIERLYGPRKFRVFEMPHDETTEGN